MSDRGANPGLYVHVPFCKSKCPYCDFFSVTNRSLVNEWLRAIEKEALFYKDNFRAFDTLYIGGGTPTCLGDSELAILLGSLNNHFTLLPEAEVTLEANPNDITLERLKHFLNLGINRISLGIQAFSDRELKFLGRRNSVLQNHRVLQWIRCCNSLILAVDLIYGLPGQTLTTWMDTLEQVLEYRPEHLSCYQLTLEERTPFGEMHKEGLLEPLSDQAGADFFLQTSDFLEEKGYLHYEISNFAKSPEHMAHHNCKYWRHVPYLGLGPAAHSLQNGVRWWNVRSVEQYCRSLEYDQSPVAEKEVLSAEQLHMESLLLGLRTAHGVPLQLLGESPRAKPALSKLQAEGLVQLHNNHLVPTKRGFLVADSLPLLFLE